MTNLKSELAADEFAKLRFHKLDIVCKKSCEEMAAFLKKEHGGLDVLVNNAGIAFKVNLLKIDGTCLQNEDPTPFGEQARVTNATNYFGLVNICDALFPLLRAGAR